VRGDLGGDAPCWAHLLDDDEVTADEPQCPGHDDGGLRAMVAATVADLGSTETSGRSGVVWSLPHGGDLDANLVHLEPGGVIDAHVNTEVDVVVSVVAGRGQLTIDGTAHQLCGDVLALVPKGVRREIRAGADGITYLSVHRRREALGISAGPVGDP
jgi:quercetin dioxygenase-like cupin family protein